MNAPRSEVRLRTEAPVFTLSSVRALRGPNLYGRATALLVSGGVHKAGPVSAAALLRLREVLPPFVPSTEIAQCLCNVVAALYDKAGISSAGIRVVPNKDAAAFTLVVPYGEEGSGRRAVADAVTITEAAIGNAVCDVPAMLKALRSGDENSRLGPTTGAIVRAAEKRGIPTRRLNDGSLVQLGWGTKIRRILASESDLTGAIAETIAQDKELTKTLLRAVGVPVPAGRTVSDADDAWSAARDIGVPVVVKPRYGSQGRGVAVDLRTREQVIAAYASAREHGGSVIVERFTPGLDHRMLVVGGKLVAAAFRKPPSVIGDGARTVRQLVEEVNADPRRGEDHATSLSKIPLDAIALAVLAEQSLAAESIPAPGQKVVLRRNANLSTGGSACDITDEVHPELAARAVDAARAVGLDVCGVDVICEDYRRPLEEQSGAIVEVNAAPGFRMHLDPSEGQPRAVGEAVIDSMFAPGDDSRIPLISVTGTNGKTTTVRLLAHMFATAGKSVGWTCTDGIYINGRRIDTGDCSGPKSARAVLANPSVDAAVLECARGGLLREGLGYDRALVAVVTNVGAGDHLGMNGIDTAFELAAVKKIVVDNVSAHGHVVLNADDALTLAMAKSAVAKVTLFSCNADAPAVKAHIAAGGRAVVAALGAVYFHDGGNKEQVVKLADVPMTHGGRIHFEVENVLAAVAAGLGSGIALATMQKALASFETGLRVTPGRFNVLKYKGATIVVDYGHNVDALEALSKALAHLPSKKRVVALTAAGDRRDEDLRDIGRIIGREFDHVVLFEDACSRGRPDGEIIRLLKEGIGRSQRCTKIDQVQGEFVALQLAMDKASAGDMAVLLIDQVEQAVKWIEDRTKAS